MRNPLLAGEGIGLVPIWLVTSDLIDSALVRVLPHVHGSPLPILVADPVDRPPGAKACAFVDY